MKANQVKAEVISAATAGALETAINTFLGGLEEEQFLEMKFAIDGSLGGGEYVVVILYME